MKVPAKWRKLFEDHLPGFDPIATAPDGCYFDAGDADKVVDFFAAKLKHIEGVHAGKPFILEDWQKAVVGAVYGFKRADGYRRFAEVFEYVPRKNGKSTFCGGLVIVMGLCDNEPGAQMYSAAADREQAALVYRQSRGMIESDPELSEVCQIRKSIKTIEFPSNTIYKALTSEAKSKHGQNTSFVIVDELHAQRDRELVDVLMTGTGSRTQPIVWHITTADFIRESICNQKLDYARKVRDGIIDDPSFLPVIYEASAEDDWTDPKVWAKVNPNLGVSVFESYLKRECQRAQDDPEFENTFKRLHLNIQTATDCRWMNMEKWDKCDGAVVEDDLIGRPCHAGLDLASRADLAAWVLVFPPYQDDPNWVVLPRIFVPQACIDRRERDNSAPYHTWAKEGWMIATDGDRCDYDTIRKQIVADVKRFDLISIGADPWNLEYLQQKLGEDLDAQLVFEFRQGFKSMSEPTKELKSLIDSELLSHGGNPVLRWMAANAVVISDDADNVKLSKKKSGEKIDALISTVMGVGRALLPDETPPPSVYETRGVLTF